MSFAQASRAKTIGRIAAATLCLALGLATLGACSNSGQSATSSAASETAASAPASQTGAIDTSSWKTLGDAFAVKTESMASSHNDNYYVCMFWADGSYVRAVAKMNDDVMKKIEAVDWSKTDVDQQIEKAVSSLPLVSAEDVTGEVIAQDELDKLAGKTGKELIDEGWVFANYYMYGGEETGAALEKGCFSYAFTFDVTVDEKNTEDGGASLMDAPVTQVELLGAADSAVDPEKID